MALTNDGMGRVGSSVAAAILQMGVATELLVTDVAPAHAEGEVVSPLHKTRTDTEGPERQGAVMEKTYVQSARGPRRTC